MKQKKKVPDFCMQCVSNICKPDCQASKPLVLAEFRDSTEIIVGTFDLKNIRHSRYYRQGKYHDENERKKARMKIETDADNLTTTVTKMFKII